MSSFSIGKTSLFFFKAISSFLLFFGNLYSLQYEGSFGLNYSNFKEPSLGRERIDEKASLFLQGPITISNNFFSRLTIYRRKAETMRKPLFRPSIFLEVSGPYYSSNFKYSITKTYPILGFESKIRREQGGLKILKKGLPTLSLDWMRYESKKGEIKNYEKRIDLHSEYQRGPLSLRYGRWEREEIWHPNGREYKNDGSSFGGQLSFNILPSLFYYLDLTHYREENKELTDIEKSEERLNTGLRGKLRDGVETYLSFSGTKGKSQAGEILDGNITSSLWLKPKTNIDLYFSRNDDLNFKKTPKLEYRYYTAGISFWDEFKGFRYTSRYSIRLGQPLDGHLTISQDFNLRIDGELIQGMSYDSYISLVRQSNGTSVSNSAELNSSIWGYPDDKTYLQIRMGKSFYGEEMLSMVGKRYTLNINGSRRFGRGFIYSFDYSAVLGKYPSYAFSNTINITRKNQILSLNYTRTEVGVYSLTISKGKAVENIGITMRFRLRREAPVSLNYTISKFMGFFYSSFNLRLSWRIR